MAEREEVARSPLAQLLFQGTHNSRIKRNGTRAFRRASVESGQVKLLAKPGERQDSHLAARRVPPAKMDVIETGDRDSLGEVTGRRTHGRVPRFAFNGEERLAIF